MWSKTLKCTHFSSTLAEKAKSDMYSVLNYMWAKYLIIWRGIIDSRGSSCVEQAWNTSSYGFVQFK